jgi:hypothetical protein
MPIKSIEDTTTLKYILPLEGIIQIRKKLIIPIPKTFSNVIDFMVVNFRIQNYIETAVS